MRERINGNHPRRTQQNVVHLATEKEVEDGSEFKPIHELRTDNKRQSVLQPLKLKIESERRKAMKSLMTGNNIYDEISFDVKTRVIRQDSILTSTEGRGSLKVANDGLQNGNGFIEFSRTNSADADVLQSRADDVYGNDEKSEDSSSDESCGAVESLTLNRNRIPGFMAFCNFHREEEIVKELKLITKYPSDGVYTFPSLETLQVWYGVIFVREGPYSEGIFHFNLILSDDFPYSLPVLRLSSKIFHPQVTDNGLLSLDREFSPWRHGWNHIWQILDFARRTLSKPTTKYAVNKKVCKLMIDNMDQFRAKARSCVLESLQLFDEQSSTQSRVGLENPFRCSLLNGEHLRQTKDALINGLRDGCGPQSSGLVGWARSRLTQLLTSGGISPSDIVYSAGDVHEF